MNNAVAGFLGAIIGAGASLIGLAIQQHYQTKRERVKLASDLALSDYQYSIEVFKHTGRGKISPVCAHVIYHSWVLDEMAKGKIDKEKMEKIIEEFKELMEVFPNDELVEPSPMGVKPK